MSQSSSIRRTLQRQAAHFEAYVASLIPAFGHADRAEPMRAYTLGLLLPGERKSVEPMAAQVDQQHVRSRHQSMHHFIAEAPWSDAAVLAAVRTQVLPAFRPHGGIQAWVVDDTGLPKKGTHSVGVARQYCGQLGKQENCQVAVSLSLANAHVSLPIAHQLYLPEEWAADDARRTQTGIPPEIVFQSKPAIALAQITAAQEAGVPAAPVLADAAYGNDTRFRDALTARGLPYVVGIQTSTTVWPDGEAPLPPPPYRGHGRPPTNVRHAATHRPIAVQDLALAVPPWWWRTVTWRDAVHGHQRARFLITRVRPAHRDQARRTPRPEEWLLVEWPSEEPLPTKYWLSTLPLSTTHRQLVRTAKLRWRIERDYEELKQELGLGHYEGRNWRGFHHHATMCIAASALLLLERARFSPSRLRDHRRGRPQSAVPPRGSPRYHVATTGSAA